MSQSNSIQSLVEKFIADLELMTRRAALEQVLAALQGTAVPAQRRGRKPGRKPGRPAGSANRSASSIDPDQLLAYVKANPGSRGEQVAAGMRSDVATIRPAMHKLIAAKKVRTTGQRRGMQYFAGTAGPRALVKPAKAKKAGRAAKSGKRGKTAKPAKRATKAKAKPLTPVTQEKRREVERLETRLSLLG